MSKKHTHTLGCDYLDKMCVCVCLFYFYLFTFVTADINKNKCTHAHTHTHIHSQRRQAQTRTNTNDIYHLMKKTLQYARGQLVKCAMEKMQTQRMK